MLFFISSNAPVLRPTSSGINIFYIYIFFSMLFHPLAFILSVFAVVLLDFAL